MAVTRRYNKMFGKSLSKFDLQKHFAKLKKHLSEFGSQALQEVVERLVRSCERLFEGRKKGEKVEKVEKVLA